MNILIIDDSATGTCQMCGATDEELRPYGPDGKFICFGCGQLDEESTAANRLKLLKSYDAVIIKNLK